MLTKISPIARECIKTSAATAAMLRLVSHPWSNGIAYLVDAHGRRYENDEAVQQALSLLRPFGWAPEYLTRAETTDTTMLVFDVPADVARPLDLMVRVEVLMGDVLDGVRFRRARVRLP